MHNLNEEMGKRIADLRKKHNMTQEVLAEKLDISIKHCSAVERGFAALSLERLMDCCDLFDTSLDFLVRGESEERLSRVPEAVIEFYNNSSSREQSFMLNFLDLLTNIKKKE